MDIVKITLASLPSLLIDPERNLEEVKNACATAEEAGARVILLPELMLTGHGGHSRMTENAEAVPEGPLTTAVLDLSARYNLCVCVGIAELSRGIVYNSQLVADRGEYLGLQRKINMSNDEYCHFGCGEKVEVFDIGCLRFGITICYDNRFPELSLIHSLNNVDVIFCPHASRAGSFPYRPWPENPSPEFFEKIISDRQAVWEQFLRTRAADSNAFVLACNVVGSSTEGLEEVVANHAGTVMGFDPTGKVILRTGARKMETEIVTLELDKSRRAQNHGPARNRRLATVIRLLEEKYREQGP